MYTCRSLEYFLIECGIATQHTNAELPYLKHFKTYFITTLLIIVPENHYLQVHEYKTMFGKFYYKWSSVTDKSSGTDQLVNFPAGML